MHHGRVDWLSSATSPVHRLDARTKLVAALVLVVTVALLPPDRALRLPLLGGLALFWVLVARLPLRYLLGRSLLVLPFALAVGALLPFRPGGQALAHLSLAGVDLTVRDDGLRLLAIVALKSWIACWAMLALACTTRFHRLLAALATFHVPRTLTLVLAFLYRYLFVVVGEAGRMRRARDARLAGRAGGAVALRAGTGILGVLFVRSYERSERVFRAMESRGWSGEVKLAEPLVMHGTDWVALAAFVGATAAAALAPLPWGIA